MTTTTIVAATTVIIMLNVLALALAMREDKQLADIKRRLEELENGEPESKEEQDGIH